MAVAIRRNFKKRENRNVPDAIPRATKMKLSFKSHQVNGPRILTVNCRIITRLDGYSSRLSCFPPPFQLLK